MPARLYTPPVNGPLDFAPRDPLPKLNLPPAPERPPATTLKLGDDVLEPWNAEPEATDDETADEEDQQPEGETSLLGDPLAPSTSTAQIPNFFIGSFQIPPFLLSIYQAAGIQYGVPWEVLAAINAIETDYGRNVNVSSAGATGWMQFMPASWRQYGVDANEDGTKDPYNPVDAIFAAARYLKAAGAEESLRKAVFAYNHADWYVDDVLRRARLIAGLPSDLVGSLTGLTQGRSPIAARLSYEHRAPGAPARSALRIRAAAGAPAVAVQDGRIMRVGTSPRLGRFVMLRDAYGNTYTYGHLAKLATNVLVAKERPAPRRSSRSAPPPHRARAGRRRAGAAAGAARLTDRRPGAQRARERRPEPQLGAERPGPELHRPPDAEPGRARRRRASRPSRRSACSPTRAARARCPPAAAARSSTRRSRCPPRRACARTSPATSACSATSSSSSG